MAKIINIDLVRAGFDGGIPADETDPKPGVDAPCTEVDQVCNGPDGPCNKVDQACGTA
jgi:hypothetical protein